MVRSDLARLLADDNPDFAPSDAKGIIAIFFNEISGRLSAGGRVELRGFGTFSTRPHDPRTGRNPRTGVVVEVAAKRVPHFKPGKEMRDQLNTPAGTAPDRSRSSEV